MATCDQHLHRRRPRRRQAAAARTEARQPPRADRRRDRHRQDRHAAGDRRGAVRRRRPDLRRRREGRHRRSRHARCGDRQAPRGLRRPRRRDRLYRTGPTKAIRSSSGTCSASRAIPSAPPSAKWGRCCSSRLMNLNEVQEGVLTIAFHVADKEGLMLLDLDDLQAMLVHIGERADELTLEYGNVSKTERRRDPALAAPASRPGRRPFLRRAGARPRGFPEARRGRQGHRQHPRRRQADGEPAALLDLPAVAARPNCSSCFPRSATPTSPSSPSSSTRRICCSRMRRRRCRKRSSRSSA